MMDCDKCKCCAGECPANCANYKPAWTPPVARFTPKTPLPDGAVCVHRGDCGSKLIYDWYWTRSGRVIGRHGESDSDLNECAIANFPEYVNAIRALGLPVWGIDINCGGETREEFWTDGELRSRGLLCPPTWGDGCPVNITGSTCPGAPTHKTIRRYHGTRRDGVSVDGWIVKPVAVEQPKPAPGQPCPSCGQPVPEPIPPAPRKYAAQENPPFKVGDWVSRYNGRTIARPVSSIACIDGKWMLRFPFDDFPYDANNYRHIFPAPGLPRLPEKVKEWASDDDLDGCFCMNCMRRLKAVRWFVRDLYPHEFGGC